MILLIDNYGSFTFNVNQLFSSRGAEISIVANDTITAAEVRNIKPAAIVISPGPGRPEAAGACVSIVKEFAGRIPILGLALGMQVIALALGGNIDKGERVMNGKQSDIIHDGRTIFEAIPSPMTVGRYDAYTVREETLPPGLLISAHTLEGEIMALRSREDLLEGVQFHPESILTPRGDVLVSNFLELLDGRM